jgi:solute carrier family 44 (choline transporter-like protein), member 1
MSGEASQPLLSPHQDGGDSSSVNTPFKGSSHKKISRKPRDLPCLLLFLACICVSIGLSITGFSQGDPALLLPSNQLADSSEIAQKGADKAQTAGQAQASLWFHDAVVSTRENIDVVGFMMLLALALALVWVQLLKKFVRPFLYLTSILGILCVLALGTTLVVFSQSGTTEDEKSARSWLLWVGLCLYVVALALCIALAVLRKHIEMTAVMFEEACRGVQHSPTIFLSALLCVAAFVGYVFFWAYSFLYLYSVPAESISTARIAVENKQMPEFNTSLRNALYFQVFMLFWVTAFISAVYQMSVAGAISAWYFSRDSQGMDPQLKSHGGPALLSMARAVSVSAGSLAFGSLVLAAIQFLNFMVRLAQKKAQASGNCCAKTCLGCVSCCLGCVGKATKFINRYAYINIAMHGSSFLSASRDVFELLGRRGLSAVVVHTLGDIVLLVGKLFGVGLVTLIAVLAIHSLGRTVAFTTVALVAFATFFLFNFFARIVSVGVDTVFVCYAEDVDHNGSGNLYCDPSVHSCLQQKIQDCQHEEPQN